MSKLRTDSTWNGLTPEQREKLDEWLFEEEVSYREARERAQREWGIESSISSVGRYYRRGRNARMLAEMAETQQAAKALDGTGLNMKTLRSSALKVIGKRLFEKAMDGCDVKELAVLGRLMSEGEKREIQHARLALARERFEFSAAGAALGQVPYVGEMTGEEGKSEETGLPGVKKPPVW